MNREQKVRQYQRYVGGLAKCIENWRIQMSEPLEYGTFDDWEICDNNGRGLTSLMDELVELASEVDPSNTQFWCESKDWIVNTRIWAYKTMKKFRDTPDPPPLTPEEEAEAEAEKAEAYRTTGASLVAKRTAPEATGDQPHS